MKKQERLANSILVLLVLIIGLAGCGQSGTEAEKEQMKLAFITKDLNHYWYQQVKEGIERYGIENDILIQCFNANYDDDKCLKQVKQIIKEKYDGLLICSSSQKLGPEISKLCKDAKIPVVAIDDSLIDEEGKEFPYVGMATREIGAIGGNALANLAEQYNFPIEEKNVKVLEIDVPELSVFRERLDGYEEALRGRIDIAKDNIITVDSKTGMYEENYAMLEAYFTENPPGVDEWWIICGCNDDCALASMHVLIEKGVPNEQIIACGMGGYELSVEEFKKQNRHYITVMTQPDVEGYQAAEMIEEYLVDKKEMNTDILIGGAVATCDNYMIYFDGGNRE